jgi:hypothetical protein
MISYYYQVLFHLLAIEFPFSRCHWKCNYVFFYLGWRTLLMVALFVFDNTFSLHLFSLFPSKPLFAMQNFGVVLWFMKISTSILIFLIFNFYSWSFCRTLICFQFYHSIPIWDIWCFLIWSLFFDFWFFYGYFVKLIFFSILPSIKNLLIFLI